MTDPIKDADALAKAAAADAKALEAGIVAKERGFIAKQVAWVKAHKTKAAFWGAVIGTAIILAANL